MHSTDKSPDNSGCQQLIIIKLCLKNLFHHFCSKTLNCKVGNVAEKWRVHMLINITKFVKVNKKSNVLTSNYGFIDWSVQQQ